MRRIRRFSESIFKELNLLLIQYKNKIHQRNKQEQLVEFFLARGKFTPFFFSVKLLLGMPESN